MTMSSLSDARARAARAFSSAPGASMSTLSMASMPSIRGAGVVSSVGAGVSTTTGVASGGFHSGTPGLSRLPRLYHRSPASAPTHRLLHTSARSSTSAHPRPPNLPIPPRRAHRADASAAVLARVISLWPQFRKRVQKSRHAFHKPHHKRTHHAGGDPLRPSRAAPALCPP